MDFLAQSFTISLNVLAIKESSGLGVVPAACPACETAAVDLAGPSIFPADKAGLMQHMQNRAGWSFNNSFIARTATCCFQT